MPCRRVLLKSAAALVALSLAAAPTTAQADEPIPVVASFSILADMVERIGGEHIDVTMLVGPDGDAHVYQPTPAAARAVSDAEILVVNGLEFEGWMDRLIEASGFDGVEVVATNGIEPIAYEGEHDDHEDHDHQGHAHAKHAEEEEHDHNHAGHDHDEHAEKAEHDHDGHDHAKETEHEHHDHAEHDDHAGHDDHDHDEAGGHHHHHHGAYDPHAWQSLGNAVIYVDNITAALAKADPENAGTFYENRAAYVAELEALDADIRAIIAGLPESRRTVVTSHDAFQYFGRDYGLTFLAPQGLSTESEASAKDVARLIERIRADGITAVFIENITDPRLLEQIANETGATIGGTLYPGALSGPNGPAPTYLDMMRHNATTLAQALSS